MRSFRTEHYVIDVSELPFGDEMPEKIAVVSDLHNTVFGTDNAPVFDVLRKESPGLIAIPGDLVTANREENRIALAFIKELSTLGIPVCYSFGNHEDKFRAVAPERYREFRKQAEDCGIHILDNAWFSFSKHVSVGGLTVPSGTYTRGLRVKKLSKEDIEACIPEKPDGIRILLAHNPWYFPSYAEYGADIVISGHVHGGVIRLPFLGGVISPQGRLFPKYDAGQFRLGNSELLVSRGLGDHFIRFSWNNPYELMIVSFKKGR